LIFFAKIWLYSLHALGFIGIQKEETTLGTPDIS